jgi:hypothetical protein
MKNAHKRLAYRHLLEFAGDLAVGVAGAVVAALILKTIL